MRRLLKKLKKTIREKNDIAYSQGLEDILIYNLFGENYKGVYVDVGAHHPVNLNNTYLLYKKGWHGLLLEPNPKFIGDLKSLREKDYVFQIAADNFSGKAKLYYGNHDVHSSLEYKGENTNKGTFEVEVKTLKDLLNENNISTIDFISIDTEGTEIKVLEGLDLNVFRPRIIMAEYNTASQSNTELIKYMVKFDYLPVFISQWNYIFSNKYEKDSIKIFKQSQITPDLKKGLWQIEKQVY